MFAAMNRVTVKALRFYEEQGLLLPAYIDSETGYRYYKLNQMATMHQISALKQAGFTLEEIGRINSGEDEEALLLKKKSELLSKIAELDMPVDKVREILRVAQEPVSLETPIGEEEDSHLGDFIQDEDTPAPADAASQTILREVIERELHTLTPREEHVIKLRFGLYDGRTRTLEEVGKEFDITRERIRQIEAKALRKLRHPSRARHLKGFLD